MGMAGVVVETHFGEYDAYLRAIGQQPGAPD